MIEEQSSECIASKIHLLQKSHFTNLPLLPLLLLTDLNPSTYNNFSASTNYTTSRTTYNKSSSSGSSSSSIEKSKSSPINRYQSNDWSKSNNICFLRKNADTKERSYFRRLLLAYWCPKSVTGDQVLLKEVESSYCFSTGIENLDNLLNGGLRTSEITEIIGKSSSGKSQFCLSLCASVLRNYKTVSIVYLDTKGDFISEGLLVYLRKQNHKYFKSLNTTAIESEHETFNDQSLDIKQCLTRIRCCLVPTIRHLIDSLVSIRMHIDKAQHHLNNSLTPTQEFFANCKLIIIDSLTMPFLLYMATLPQFGISQLAVVISELQRLSALNHCAVLVTNHARSSFINTSNKQQYNRRLSLSPVSIGCLGVNWSLIPNHRVLFERSIQRKDDMTIKIKAKKVNKLHKTNRQSSSCIRQKYNSEIIYEFNL